MSLIVLLLSLVLGFLSLPFFFIGLWSQSELVVAAIYMVGCMASFTLVLKLSFQRNKQAHENLIAILYHPYVLVFLLMAAWSAFSTLFHEVPMRGFYGSSELGEGVFMFVSMAMLLALGIIVFKEPWARRVVLWVAVFCVLLIALLDYIYNLKTGWMHTMYYYSDYIAFFAIYIFAIVLMFSSLPMKVRLTAALAIFGFLMLRSDNNTAILLSVAIIPFVYFLSRFELIKERWNLLSTVGLVLAPFVLTFAVVGLGLVFGYWDDDSIVEAAPTFAGYIMTMLSRYYMIPIVFDAMVAEPLSWFFGTGWASFGVQQITFFPTERIDLLGGGGPDWEGVWRDHFHSHNMFVDALLAAGLPGLFIFTASIVLVPLFARKEVRVHATVFAFLYCTLAAFWFQMPVSVPFLVLAIAGFADVKRMQDYLKRYDSAWLRSVAIVVLVCLVPIQLFAAYSTFDLSKKTSHIDPPTRDWDGSDCEDIYYDYGRGGLHLAKMYRVSVTQLLIQLPEIHKVLGKKEVQNYGMQAVKGQLDTAGFLKVKYFACLAKKYIDSGDASLRLRLVDIIVRSDIALSMMPYLKNEDTRFVFDRWDLRIKEFIDFAPKRTDQAAPYMIWHLNNGYEAQVNAMADFLLERDAHDIVGMWFKGIVLLGDANHAALGLQMMYQALDGGIERIVPIDDELKESIGWQKS